MDDFDITFQRKKVKHYSIRVDSDGTVRVTVPFSGTMREAERFVASKADWIVKKRQESMRRIPLDPATLKFGAPDAEYLTWLTEQVYPRFRLPDSFSEAEVSRDERPLGELYEEKGGGDAE